MGDGFLCRHFLQVAAFVHRDFADWHGVELSEAVLEREGEASRGGGAGPAGKRRSQSDGTCLV